MVDWEENEPGEWYIRLLKFFLGMIAVYLLFPCVSGSWQLDQELVASFNVSNSTANLLLFSSPYLLVVMLSVAGIALARTLPSRILFVGTGLLGFVVFVLFSAACI